MLLLRNNFKMFLSFVAAYMLIETAGAFAIEDAKILANKQEVKVEDIDQSADNALTDLFSFLSGDDEDDKDGDKDSGSHLPDWLRFGKKKVKLEELSDYTVKIRVVNKRVDRVYNYELVNNEVLKHGELLISAHYCLENFKEVADNNVAYIKVDKKSLSRKDDVNKSIFTGWLYQQMPSASTVNDAVYDIRMVGCSSVVANG